MRIDAVIIDYGGVLCFPPRESQIASAAERCRLSASEFLRAFWSIRIEYDAGKMSPEQYWRRVAKHAGRDFDRDLIAQMIEAEIDFWSRIDDRVLDWNDQLRSAGLQTAVLSNLPLPLGRRLRTQNFYDHFDHATLSFELGVVKPRAEIYEHAVRGLGVAPAHALFLDDREENVEGARAIGLHAGLFTSWEAFVGEMPGRYALPAPALARRQ
ncbi:MAG TPA: HAD family phosphatase [Bryobacteraceae bacterium]|nr:HAD family phosphatase [Bryobacteraceae bacterium]